MRTGGMLDTYAAIKAGFRPAWGTEIDERKRSLWRKLTRTRDLGSTWNVNWEDQLLVDLLITGQPCTNYSSSDYKLGESGDTGYMYVKQSEPILKIQPNTFCLEMVANVKNIDSGEATQKLKDALEHNYVIKDKVIRTIDHGDASNKERIFVVGVHKRLGPELANSFEWPRTDDKRHLEARRLAEPDEDVPEQYVRRHKSPIKVTHKSVQEMHMRKLAQMGKGNGTLIIPTFHILMGWDMEYPNHP